MNVDLPPAFDMAVREFSRLPGIGERTAERLIFHLLNQPPAHIERLGQSLLNLPKQTLYCTSCHHLTHEDPCSICRDEGRSNDQLCVVEMPQDIYKLEEVCDYAGRYHVLGGLYAPLEGVFPEDLHIDSLCLRVERHGVSEVVLALNPNTEGEATSELITSRLKNTSVKLTRLATGMAFGSEIQWVGRSALQDAFAHRREV